MEKEGNEVPDVIQPLTAEDKTALEDFRREMTERVIPEILKVVEERRVLAAESRQWQLKC